MGFGNNTETNYQYEADRRRLQHLSTTSSTGRKLMDNTYSYDAVNNITQLKSNAPITEAGLRGGRFEYNYQYDHLYRLTGANGHFEGGESEHKYELSMEYSKTGCILHKDKKHWSRNYDNTNWDMRGKTTYDWTYQYEGVQPHAPTQIGENVYTYDANGNTTGWQSTKNNNRRDILWDSLSRFFIGKENRIRALADNGKTHHYMYDASGERVIKSTGDGQAIYINGFPMGGSGTVGNYTMYVNPYMVVTNMKFTKHFYIEGQRIVSKLGEMGEYQYLLNPKDTLAGGGTIDFDLKGNELKEAIYANFEALGLDGAVFTAGKSGKVPYGRLKKYYRNQDLVNAGGGNTNQPDSDGEPSNKVENLQFYYHPDHLGSSSYITDVSGEVYQHMEYFPFGETFIEERTDAEYTSYLYNGKELDEETGLYYYGARYYDPRISMWYGVDPLTDKYPNWSGFAYTFNNPIFYKDPDGKDPREGGKPVNKIEPAGAYSLNNGNFRVLSYDASTNILKKINDKELFMRVYFGAVKDGVPEFVQRVLSFSGDRKTFNDKPSNPSNQITNTIRRSAPSLGFRSDFVEASASDFYSYEEIIRNDNGDPIQRIVRHVKSLGKGFESEVTYKETYNLSLSEGSYQQSLESIEWWNIKDMDKDKATFEYGKYSTNDNNVSRETIEVEARKGNTAEVL